MTFTKKAQIDLSMNILVAIIISIVMFLLGIYFLLDWLGFFKWLQGVLF